MTDEQLEAEDRGLWSTRRVAEELSVSVRTIHRHRINGKIRAVNVGAGSKPRWRFDPNTIRAFARGEDAQETPLTRRGRTRHLPAVPAYF